MLQLTAEEKAVRSASDAEVERWLAEARSGDPVARENLCCWAYLTAAEYYRAKMGFERLISLQDAEELTSQFFLEFEQSIPSIRTATHFARRLLKAKLGRYIRREKKHQKREIGQSRLDLLDTSPAHDEHSDRPWESWTDTEWYQYRATLEVLNSTDPRTREILEARARGMGYEEIVPMLGLSEAALRMRVARFYKAVRNRFKALTG